MSERIDHAAEARQAIIEAGDGRNPVTAAGSNAVAHAILALVEQQRIANLIALSESGRTTVNGARAALSGLYDGNPDHGSANLTLRTDVAAALGLAEGGAE